MSNTTEKVTKTNRHYGEGSIYQRKDGRWVAKYRDEAMAKPQYLYGSTEAEVRRKLRDWKKQTARGLTACKKVFFRDYADNWFYTFKQHSVENSSFDRYESIYLHHIKPNLGDIQIASIRSEEIQNLLIEKSKTLSYSVVKKINFLLSELFQYAHSEGDIAKNPMQNVKMPKKTLFKQKRTILVMEDEEVQALEQVATLTCHNDTPQIMHANAIVFLVHTGLRCGELQALKWSDIDFANETVTVSKNFSMIVNRDRKPGQKHRNAKIKGTKTASGNRIVPLNEKETGGSLFDRLSDVGAQLLVKTLEEAKAGTLKPQKQNEEEASYVKMIKKSFGELDFSKESDALERLIRGLNPWPSAFTHLNGKMLKIWDADVYTKEQAEADFPEYSTDFKGAEPGQIAAVLPHTFFIGCGKDLLKVNEVQAEGKKRMTSDAFLRGSRLEKGMELGK